jgi:hypothetical protein
MSIEDVTGRVNAAVKPNMSPEEAFKARRGVMAEIEQESLDKTKLRSDVITLYQGGAYHLYRFKKYTDIRLVFAPEKDIAFYGGDPDNFEYPRYDLDICFFRVYEDGKPAKIEHHLKWSPAGAKDNELVFVSGHPGRTNRLNTTAELAYLRDTGYPYLLQRLNRMEVMLEAFSQRTEENRRQADEILFSVKNSRKARIGGLAALLDPELMRKKREEENSLQGAAFKDAKLKDDPLGPWKKIAAAQEVRAKNIKRYTVLEGGAGFNSDLFGYARTLVRAAEEEPKPDGERLREYRKSARESLEFRLFAPVKVFPEFETVKLTDSLTFLATQLGYDDPLVKKVLDGKSPAERAHQLVSRCHLGNEKQREQIYKDGKAALARDNDPMIALAQLVDAEARAVRKIMETDVEEVSRSAYNDISRIKFALEGTNTYPDATFTLRLSFGVVKGYEENGKHVPFETHFAGLYERSAEHKNKDPFELPKRWLERKDRLDPKVPLNFICTADIIGGNSGSPVINRDAELVGIIFDGNIQSLALDFAFTEVQARAVSVHSQGIIEALRKVYDAGDLADELTGRKQE